MFTINPFSELSELISPFVMQVYVITMILLVVGGTILDMIHKKSAQYFFNNAERPRLRQRRRFPVAKRRRLQLKPSRRMC